MKQLSEAIPRVWGRGRPVLWPDEVHRGRGSEAYGKCHRAALRLAWTTDLGQGSRALRRTRAQASKRATSRPTGRTCKGGEFCERSCTTSACTTSTLQQLHHTSQ
eukprot:13960092-Alexandrium_andersonii.AAC.1